MKLPFQTLKWDLNWSLAEMSIYAAAMSIASRKIVSFACTHCNASSKKCSNFGRNGRAPLTGSVNTDRQRLSFEWPRQTPELPPGGPPRDAHWDGIVFRTSISLSCGDHEDLHEPKLRSESILSASQCHSAMSASHFEHFLSRVLHKTIVKNSYDELPSTFCHDDMMNLYIAAQAKRTGCV